jgi:hypothetical protein
VWILAAKREKRFRFLAFAIFGKLSLRPHCGSGCKRRMTKKEAQGNPAAAGSLNGHGNSEATRVSLVAPQSGGVPAGTHFNS